MSNDSSRHAAPARHDGGSAHRDVSRHTESHHSALSSQYSHMQRHGNQHMAQKHDTASQHLKPGHEVIKDLDKHSQHQGGGKNQHRNQKEGSPSKPSYENIPPVD